MLTAPRYGAKMLAAGSGVATQQPNLCQLSSAPATDMTALSLTAESGFPANVRSANRDAEEPGVRSRACALGTKPDECLELVRHLTPVDYRIPFMWTRLHPEH